MRRAAAGFGHCIREKIRRRISADFFGPVFEIVIFHAVRKKAVADDFHEIF
jgi:hypothetical protein